MKGRILTHMVTTAARATRSSVARKRKGVGYMLLVAGDLADCYGVMVLVVAVLTPALNVESPGTAAAVPIAAVLAALAIWQPPARALSMLMGLAGALGLCAVFWPASLYVAGPCLVAAILLRIGAHELSARPRRARVGGAAIVTAFFAVTIANGTLDLQTSGTEVAYVLAMLLPLILAMHLVVCLLRREHPVLDRAGAWWTRRALARLAARGLRLLTPADAPLFYARVDAAGDEWAYEVRIGQDIVATGRCKRERKADQAAARACFEHTFRAPFARRPGALYVLACPTGSPYQRQVTELFAAASTISATYETAGA